MSRCFPYPPQAHLRNGVRVEAVREPIKRDWEITITEHDRKGRKDKREREEKKEKKKKKKKNFKGVEELCYGTYKQGEKSHLPKGKEEETEKSSLTEEHEQPVCSQSQCYSPDSNRISNKRKQDDSGAITRTHGNILRIRLPLQRHREPGTPASTERLSSVSDTVSDKAECRPECKGINTIPCQEECSLVNSKPGSSGAIEQTCVTNLKVKENKRSSLERKEQTVESLYKALIEEWIPPTLEFDQNNFDDQDWLFDTKKQESHENKTLKVSRPDETCSGRPNLWPCARHLPEADVYSLPFTVPF